MPTRCRDHVPALRVMTRCWLLCWTLLAVRTLRVIGEVHLEEAEAATAEELALMPPRWWLLNSFVPQHSFGAEPDQYRKQVSTQTTEPQQDPSALSLILDLNDQRESSEMPQAASTAVGSPNKRTPQCGAVKRGRCRRGEVSKVVSATVRESWKSSYTSVPNILVEFSQKQAEETACRDLAVNLYQVEMDDRFQVPVWIRGTRHLGMCPSKLQLRNLGENVMPPSVVEIKCLCQKEPCSALGGDFRCQAIKAPITTWVRHEADKHIPSQELITVGCACIQRASPQGKYAWPHVLT